MATIRRIDIFRADRVKKTIGKIKDWEEGSRSRK